jgi:integrase
MAASGDVVEAFVLHEQLVGYSARTVERRASTIHLFLESLEGAEPTRAGVEAFLVARPAQETRRGYLGDLRRFYGWAVTRGHASSDPTEGIETPRVPTRDPSPLSPGDVVKVRSACRNRQDRLVIGLGLFAGLRVSEIAHLEVSDVRDGYLMVRAGKGGKDRRVPVAEQLADDLAAGVVRANTRDGVYYRIKGVFRRAGVIARPHDLRHTFATELARVSGGNVTLVAALCGHASVQTTQRYIGWRPDGCAEVGRLYSSAA